MPQILVIEDEPCLREEILDILIAEGFDVIGAEDGTTGINLAQSHPLKLILCDVMMSGADGYEVLSTLRQHPEGALIPFIFLTAKGKRDDVRQGMNLGADDYLTKPFTTDELLNAVSAQLAKQEKIAEIHQKMLTLQHSNLLKDEFLEAASQELKSPATNLIMVSKLLQKASAPEETQRYIEILQRECSREIDLINDLSDLHALDTNKRPLQLEPLNLQAWIPAIIEPFRAVAKARQQLLWSNVPPYLPMPMLDAADLKQILNELLKNACKYTAPGGKIVLEARYDLLPSESVSKTDQTITVIISNQAEIPGNAISYLFRPFYRVPELDRWQQGGNGLGLAIIERLANRLRGSITVSSQAGWTQFILQLPVQPDLSAALAAS